jgi:hypothetical protein
LKTPKKVEFIGPKNRSTKRTKTVCIVSNQQIENSGLPKRLMLTIFFEKKKTSFLFYLLVTYYNSLAWRITIGSTVSGSRLTLEDRPRLPGLVPLFSGETHSLVGDLDSQDHMVVSINRVPPKG